ncbi:MAG TPA: GreA/GreB family elongation factor [Bacteroidales bacterium]|nr:GreA/GreB family elongation factor [Bacteroidales bacterium]
MSRGFVKEDDQEEVPMVPQRAYLPAGVTNFVTPAGLQQLNEEKQALLKEKETIGGANENEKRIALNHLNARLQLLNNRITGAKVIIPDDRQTDEIRFGAYIELEEQATGRRQVFQIVGVDEAAASRGKISFISPLSRVLMNKSAGEKVILKRASDDVTYKILKISY